MGTQVDDLQIKLSAEADKANKAIDLLISKLGTLEGKISVFGKIKSFDSVKSGAASVSSTVSKEMSKAADAVSRYTAKAVDKSAEQIETLKKSYSGLGKDFEKNGGFANLKTPRAFEKAIDDYKVKIARAFENAAKADTQKGFNSAIKSAIQYTNILDSLNARLKDIKVVENKVPNGWAEEKAAIEEIRRRVQSLTEEELKAATSLDKVRIRGVNDSNISEIEARITRINDNLRGVDTGRFADYDAMAKALKEDLSYLQEMQSYIEQNMPQYAKTIDNVAEAIDHVNTEIESVLSKTSGGGKEAEKIQLGFYSATKEISGFVKVLENMKIVKPRENFISLQKDIENTEKRLEKLYTQMEQGMNRSGNDFLRSSTYKGLVADIKAAEDQLKSFAKAMEGIRTHEIDWGSIGSKMRESFSSVLGIVKNVTSHVFSLANALNKRIVGGFANLARNLNKTDDIAKKLFKSFTRVSNMLRLMITRMALRAVITETRTSFGELLQFSDKTAASFNKIRNAIKYLADTIVTLTAPILNASGTFRGLGNIIDMVSDKIVELINKFNQLLSALLGHSTWIKATKQTKDYTKEVDKAGKAAKKALQPFDELNNLTSNDNNGGSGGASGGGAQYQELPIDEKWTDIAKWLKDQWEKSDFTQLGQVLGEKMRDAMNNIPWDSLKETAAKVGKSLGTLINGFVETPGLPEAIGKAIGEALNTVVTGISNFVDATHFESIGRFIGVSIINAVKTINWAQLKSTAGDIGSSVAKGINSFFDTGVLESIGKAVGETLTAGINLWYNFVTKLDFSMIGGRIRDGLNSFLNSMSDKTFDGLSGWEKLGKAISDSITGFLKTANIVLGDEETRTKIANAISDFIDSISWQDIYNGIKELSGNIVKAVETVIKGIFNSETFKTNGLALVIDGTLLTVSVTSGATLLKTITAAIAPIIATISVKATLVVAIGAITWKIGNKIYSALDQHAFDMSIGQQVSYIANTTIGEATYAIKMMLYDPDGNPLTQFGNNVLLNMLPGGGVADFIINLKAGTFDSSLQWIKDNNPISKTVNVIKGSIDAAVSALAGGNSTTSLTVSVIEAVKGAAQALYNLIKGIVDFCKNPVSFTLKMVGTETAAEKLPIIGSALKSINNIKGKGKNGAITKKATFSLKSEVTENGQSTKLSALTKVGASIKNLATSWGILKAKGGTANITANASWASGTKESLEKQINDANLTVEVNAKAKSFTYAQQQQHINAQGGVFAGGKWKPIQSYATGGIVSAEMFLARENGMPELVGRLGSHTAVANNDQIVSSVADGVYRAVKAAIANSQTEAGNTNVNVELVGDVANLFKAIRKEGNSYQRRTGNPVFA